MAKIKLKHQRLTKYITKKAENPIPPNVCALKSAL